MRSTAPAPGSRDDRAAFVGAPRLRAPAGLATRARRLPGRRLLGLAACGLILLVAGCGDHEEGPPPWLHVPIVLPTMTAVLYQMDWKQETHHGDADQGVLTWDATLEMRPALHDTALKSIELRRMPGSKDVSQTTSTFAVLPDGRFAAVRDFVNPAGYQVRRGGVAAFDQITPAAWLEARFRPLPGNDLADAAATWTVPDVLDGLPMSLGLRLTVRVEKVDETRVVLSGTGEVVVPEVNPDAQPIATWVKAAKKTVEAHYVLSRKDGLLIDGTVELRMESDHGWDPGDARPTRTRNVLRVQRR